MVRREKTNYIIQSVSHALDVLEQFTGEADELGVTELSNRKLSAWGALSAARAAFRHANGTSPTGPTRDVSGGEEQPRNRIHRRHAQRDGRAPRRRRSGATSATRVTDR